jgi:hypothetical protein
MNGKFTKKELEKFLHIFNKLTVGRSKEALVPFSDEVCNFPDDLDRLMEEFLGTGRSGISDFELQSIWESGKTIKEFKEWLSKKSAKRKGK